MNDVLIFFKISLKTLIVIIFIIHFYDVYNSINYEFVKEKYIYCKNCKK